MIAYFDASALVKLVVEEAGSADAASLFDAADAVATSRVAYPEVRAAFAAARRNRRLTDQQHGEAVELWETLWASLRVLELDEGLAQRAGDLAQEHALSGAAAVHLASALLLRDDETAVTTWDRRLHAAAATLGLATVPGALDP